MKSNFNIIKGQMMKSMSNKNISFEGAILDNTNKKMPTALDEIINKISKCAREEDSDMLLDDISKNNKNFKQLSTNLYKYKDYYVEGLYKRDANKRCDILKKLQDANINIAPKLVNKAEKQSTMYLISNVPGTENGDLIPYQDGYKLLSDKAKKSAYKDVQKMLKLGINNNAMSRGTSSWFVTPQNSRVVIMDWDNIRPLNDFDNK